MRPPRAALTLAVTLLAASALAACGGPDSAASAGSGPVTVRLGYFPNITHATALVGVEKGTFAGRLGPDRLETKVFNAGPAAVEALFSGALDAAYIGPNPAINAFVKSKGEAVRIVAGATSGGAALVVKPDIRSAADLRGKKVASPQLGGTQDVALRAWLKSQGLATNATGGGDVTVLPQENAQTLETFRSGAVAGAWVPEPWAARLVLEAGGTVLVDEASLWPGGRFVTTHLVVRTAFLRKHPATVRRLLEGHAEATAFVNADPAQAQALANQGIEKATGKKLAHEVVTSAWSKLLFTNDPVASSLRTSADHAAELGLLGKADLDGIYDVALLNEVLAARNEAGVDAR